ncbi:hypothetical protein KVT40_000987 [Elsinoe batatas]|uniref:Uncharacterized protein n=1 Tax=Elsinoe batatas TaxID=2601811 RepID=A0A8K0PKT1_9PEZI|nr:hypothetical protein KVT40_000987 [Elsinoe batatas]
MPIQVQNKMTLGTSFESRGLELHAYKQDLDLHLVHPATQQGAYLFRVPRNPGDEVFALHSGNKLDPVVAAVRFRGYFSGDLTIGNPAHGSAWGQWEQPSSRAYTAFRATTSKGERKYRWVKTRHTKRTGLVKLTAYHVWVLKDVTELTVASNNSDCDVATLSLEADLENRPSLRDKILDRENGEDHGKTLKGVLHFEKQLPPAVKDAAVVLILALWSRDRSIEEHQPLAPHIDINEPKNAKYMASMVAGAVGGAGLAAAGGGIGAGMMMRGWGGGDGGGGGGGDGGGGGGC